MSQTIDALHVGRSQTRRSSGKMARSVTSCAVTIRRTSFPVSTSQTRIVLSSLQDTTRRPAAPKATFAIPSLVAAKAHQLVARVQVAKVDRHTADVGRMLIIGREHDTAPKPLSSRSNQPGLAGLEIPETQRSYPHSPKAPYGQCRESAREIAPGS